MIFILIIKITLIYVMLLLSKYKNTKGPNRERKITITTTLYYRLFNECQYRLTN